jgi:hypothetical protein
LEQAVAARSWPQHDGGETALNETGGALDARDARRASKTQ